MITREQLRAMAPVHPTAWAMYASGYGEQLDGDGNPIPGGWSNARHIDFLTDRVLEMRAGKLRRLCVSLPPGHSKPLCVRTPVATTSGWKEHGSLRPGDFVFSPEGKPVRVNAVTPHHYDDTYRVTFSDGSTLTAGAGHEWDVLVDRDCKRSACSKSGLRRGHRHSARLETRNLLAGYHRRPPAIPVAEPLQREDADLPLAPYALGLWLGDGSSRAAYITAAYEDARHYREWLVRETKSSNKGSGYFLLASDEFRRSREADEWLPAREAAELMGVDKRTLHGLARRGQVETRAAPSRVAKGRRTVCTFNPKSIWARPDSAGGSASSALRALGLYGNKHIPRAYQEASVRQRLDLLQGLMDTDGGISRSGQASFSNSNERLAADVEELVRGLGFACGVTVGRAMLNGKDCGPHYRVSFTPMASMPVFRLPRKLARQTAGESAQARFRYVKEVVPTDRVPLNCINVEGGRYLAGRELIATHNSETLSLYVASWWLATKPTDRVVVASYGKSLALGWAERARDLLSNLGLETFGVTANSRQSAEWWYPRNAAGEALGGYFFAVGRGGALTGKRAELLIIDDLLKDDMEAQSQAVRDAAWAWFDKVAMTRLMPRSCVVVIGTRWHDDDVIGRLEVAQQEGRVDHPWTFVNLPALAEEDDPLGRKPGEPLWPEMWDRDALLRKEQAHDPGTWAALFQGRPVPAGGAMFHAGWVRSYERHGQTLRSEDGELAVPMSRLKVYATVDVAGSKKERADWTVISTWGIDHETRTLWLLDVLRRRLHAPEIIAAMREVQREWEPTSFRVERAAPQVNLVHKLRFAEAAGAQYNPADDDQEVLIGAALDAGLPVIKLDPGSTDKVTRAGPAAAVMSRGRLLTPKAAPWLTTWLGEVLRFPGAKHDDQVDTLSYGAQVFLEVLQAQDYLAQREQAQRQTGTDAVAAALARRVR